MSSLVTASLLAACSGAGPTAPVGGIPQGPAGAVHSKPPKFLRLQRTPPRPPPHRHAVTAAMRARAKAGGWQELTNSNAWSNGPATALLMTDGTVLVQDYCTSNWYRLTPDSTGSYQNGTWSAVAPMPSNYGPLYFASAVLADGKLIINGGEYNFCTGDETNLGAIYDPTANTWTAVSGPSGWPEIGDAQSVVLNNGTYMIGNCCTEYQAELDEATMTWTQVGGASGGKKDNNSEEGWTLLRNGQVLTADVLAQPNSELFNPKTSGWSTAGSVGVNLTQSEEIGPQSMRPDGTVYVEGANGLSAIYSANGTWTQGPNLPKVSSQQLDAADAPTTVLTDGTVLAVGSPGVYQTPASFYIFNGKKNLTVASPPDAVNDSSYNIRTLMLPTGQVLEDDGSSDVEIYTGNQKTYPGIAPEITKVSKTLTTGSTYPLSGKRLNGFTQANFYGDDDTQATNYPLVRITNSGSGAVVYARTHNHSFMGIGSKKVVSTMFDVPSTIATGPSTLVVVVNGIPSKAVSVNIQSSK
ncbi:MAG: hypothetical protein ACLQHL_15320 [Candidatus Cybelea sp.]